MHILVSTAPVLPVMTEMHKNGGKINFKSAEKVHVCKTDVLLQNCPKYVIALQAI